ncbi:MAG: ChbG/HpnK family deacetylase [Erysipelotrichaceae bacterium]|nr:ChbG/HpnK family deacetylase [Erysipelotrichaceae bacterium]
MYKRLIIRADDVGYTLAFDLGAFKAIDEGIVTSADVMFDSPHTEEALMWLKERPWISVGWHRHLWESPVLPAGEVPHMVDEEGRFPWRHRKSYLMNNVPYQEAYREFMAEMERCYRILGRYPDTASANPEKARNELEKAFLDVCNELGINIDFWNHVTHFATDANIRDQNSDITREDYKKFRYDLSKFKDYDPAQILMDHFIWDDDEKILMGGAHPGYLDDHILAESTCTIHRVRELQAFTSQKMKDFIIENKIMLISSRDGINGTHEYQDHLEKTGSPLWVGNF